MFYYFLIKIVFLLVYAKAPITWLDERALMKE